MKKEFFEKLKENESYKLALDRARSGDERKKLELAAESMFDALSEIFEKFSDLKNDPEKMKLVIEELKDTKRTEG